MTAKKDNYNLTEEYIVLKRSTMEEVNMQVFLRDNKNGWEKAYAENLAKYIGLGGSSTTKILAYLIRIRTPENLVHGTYKYLAKEMDVSVPTLTKVFKKLKEEKMLKIIRNGCYFVSPHIIRNGIGLNGIVMIDKWNAL